jgi:hypothetical protein
VAERVERRTGVFGTKQKAPADSEFVHGEDCPTKNAWPEWGRLGGGQWERVCNCRREVWSAPDERLDPNSNAAMPSWRAHLHAPGCEAAEVEAVVRIERREGSSGWRSTCSVCTSQWVYFWDADRTDRQDRPIGREANVLYQYPLTRASGTSAA